MIDYFKTLTQEELDNELWAQCNKGNLEAVRYLLASPELKEHADMYANQEFAFQVVCYNNHNDLIDFFLFEKNFQVNDLLRNQIKKSESLESNGTYEFFLSRESRRDLFLKMSHELNDKSQNEKKTKI